MTKGAPIFKDPIVRDYRRLPQEVRKLPQEASRRKRRGLQATPRLSQPLPTMVIIRLPFKEQPMNLCHR